MYIFNRNKKSVRYTRFKFFKYLNIVFGKNKNFMVLLMSLLIILLNLTFKITKLRF